MAGLFGGIEFSALLVPPVTLQDAGIYVKE
jgi:hypothetical protein